MNTNDPNNPMTSGTGGGANYGTSNTGTGLGNSGLTSNESTSYGAGTDYSGASGGSTSSDSTRLDSTTETNASPVESNTTGYTSSEGGSATGSSYGVGNPTTDDYQEGSTTSGMFKDRASAEKAYQAMHDRGYHKDDVHLMMSDDTRKEHFGHDTTHTDLGDKAMEGAGVGSAIGGTAGAIIGAIAAIGTSIALPGLGLIIAGPLVAALAGAGAGGLTGGLVGALVGSGIPEEHAVEYEKGIKDGGIVMGVKPRNAEDAKYFEQSFKENKADKVYRY